MILPTTCSLRIAALVGLFTGIDQIWATSFTRKSKIKLGALESHNDEDRSIKADLARQSATAFASRLQ